MHMPSPPSLPPSRPPRPLCPTGLPCHVHPAGSDAAARPGRHPEAEVRGLLLRPVQHPGEASPAGECVLSMVGGLLAVGACMAHSVRSPHAALSPSRCSSHAGLHCPDPRPYIPPYPLPFLPCRPPFPAPRFTA